MRLFLTRSESAALRRCIAMLQVSRSGFALSLLLGVTALGSAIALGGTAAWLIARASQQPPVLYLTVAATSVRLFGVSRALARYLSRLASHKVALEGMDALRANLYDRLCEEPASSLSSLRRGDLMTRAGADVDEVGNVVVKTLLPSLVALVVGVGTVGVVTLISPPAGLVLALALIVSGIVAPALIARSVRLAETQGSAARTDIAATTLAVLEGATELSLAGTLPHARTGLDGAEAELADAIGRSAKLSALARGLDVCAMGAAVIGALLIGIPQTTSGALAQVLLAVIVLVPLSSFEGAAELAPAAAQLVRSAQAAERICALLSDQGEVRFHVIPAGETVIEARDLAIGWPGGPTLTTGISLTLRPGSSLAIVGASGIGKTTLLATLTGVIPPKSGQALINGVPAWGADRDQVAAHVTMTAEDAHIFATTARSPGPHHGHRRGLRTPRRGHRRQAHGHSPCPLTHARYPGRHAPSQRPRPGRPRPRPCGARTRSVRPRGRARHPRRRPRRPTRLPLGPRSGGTMSHDHTDFTLLKAALDLTSSLDLTAGLQNFVNQACALTSSPHAALAVLDTWGATTLQLEHHDSRPAPEVPEALTTAIPVASPLLVNSPADAPDLDLPADTPPFLGVSVLVHEQVYGRLYLTGKPGGYTSEDAAVVAALAPAAGIAVENAHLYADSKRTARWISASQSLTTTMLEGADEEEALELIAKTVRDVSHADTAIIVLQSVGDTWAAEITDGKNASALLGLTFPPEGRAMSVLHEGTGMIVDSMSRAQTMRVPQLAAFGSALYAPLRSRGVSSGVLILLRQIGAPEFDASELSLAESLASQATLALELASARHAQDVAALLDERDRIGRDLHDFAIQQLFATGMALDAAKQKVAGGQVDPVAIESLIDDSLASIDEAVRQIRTIVHNLRERDKAVGLVERIRRESSLTRSALGFAPSLLITLDGDAINSDLDNELVVIDEFDGRVDPDLSDDVVAIVREGLSNIARHAHATAATVCVDVSGQGKSGRVRILITDDGRGIDPERTRNSGMANMAERARRHRGTFDAGPGEGGVGTQLRWIAPLE